MQRLSRDPTTLEQRYDVIVVGSGYGGGVAASRLARMGLSVAVLERGREFRAGEFPDTIAEAEREFQVSGPDGHVGSRTGLFDLHLGKDIHVFVGCGLGGTSLINANVALPPDPRVWEDPVWPHEVIADHTLETGFERARAMLRPAPYPNEVRLDKLARLAESAAALGGAVSLPPINVTFKDEANAANVEQPACTLCGDCCSGCNVGAKNTVDLTYIADAVNHGAAVFTEVRVRAVAKDAAGWRVLYRPVEIGEQLFAAPERSVTAKIVVLAAGSLGSTEILLRSRDQGLALSPRLGHGFTGNGDALAFGYNNDHAVNGIGIGTHVRLSVAAPGPCIAGAIDLRGADRLGDGMIIEEGVIPSGLQKILPALFGTAADLFGKDTDAGPIDQVQELARRQRSALLGSYQGAMHNTQTYLVMAHDDGGGRIVLDDDRARVDWPGVARQPIYQRISESLYKATAANGGTFIRNPLQSTFLGKNLVTVHPLGGCGMASSAELGVVNHKCQVLDAAAGAAPGAVHEGLYVCDGAAVPRPLGVNPLLTITALAERAMIHLAADIGRILSDAPKADAPRRSAGALDPGSKAVGVTFTERMAGHIASVDAARSYDEAADVGKRAGAAFSFTATITIDDVERFVADKEHSGRISGTVRAPSLSPEPLDIREGLFNLMRPDEADPKTRRFDYRMRLETRDGRSFAFAGHKVVHHDPAPDDLWRDTTRLFVDIAELGGDKPKPQLAGLLTIAPADFIVQLQTIRGHGGTTPADRVRAVAVFGAVFAGSLFDVYGGALAPLSRFNPDKMRKRRDLRVPQPEVRAIQTADGKTLRLTRYNGGSKGPLLFTHGLGVSSLIFSIDTIDTNLLEHMVAAGYDCWLLDYRASIDLEYAGTPWTADDVANHDYPTAVAHVLEATNSASLQVIAHCFGATTFTMAMLAGLQGVRSAVISQISTDVIVPWWPQRLLAHLRLPSLFAALGIPFVDARATTYDGIAERVMDGLIRIFVPFRRDARSRSATSNRITALYGQLYEIGQLNRLTFESGLPEMFGAANIEAFKQLAAIARKTYIVDAKGRNTYLQHPERLAIPVLFVHGAENACFRPESTERTIERLATTNGRALYERHVIPGYGHIDCIFGKSAATDVYPLILSHLEKTADVPLSPPSAGRGPG